MQQVFLLVNRLLRKEPATCKRRLSIRTYKVGLSVPCSVCLCFWSFSPSHNPPTPSLTLHTLHLFPSHILTIHPHPHLYPQPSHISSPIHTDSLTLSLIHSPSPHPHR